MVTETEKMEIANRLKEVRETCGLTQEALAMALDLSYSGYKKIESGENTLSSDISLKLKKQGFPADYIMYGKLEKVEEIWNMLQRSSEEDKFDILLRLVTYFTKMKKKTFSVGKIEIDETNLEMIKAILKDGE